MGSRKKIVTICTQGEFYLPIVCLLKRDTKLSSRNPLNQECSVYQNSFQSPWHASLTFPFRSGTEWAADHNQSSWILLEFLLSQETSANKMPRLYHRVIDSIILKDQIYVKEILIWIYSNDKQLSTISSKQHIKIDNQTKMKSAFLYEHQMLANTDILVCVNISQDTSNKLGYFSVKY